MSIQLPPSESKGMSMRDYQRIYPHTLTEQTLTESRMVHRALIHRLNKDLKEWQKQYRWQRITALPRSFLSHFKSAISEMSHVWGNLKMKAFRWLLRDHTRSASAPLSLHLSRKHQLDNHLKSSASYRF